MYSDVYSDVSTQQLQHDEFSAPTCTVRRAASLLVNRGAVHSSSTAHADDSDDDTSIDDQSTTSTSSGITGSTCTADSSNLNRLDDLLWEFEVRASAAYFNNIYSKVHVVTITCIHVVTLYSHK